MQPRYCGKIFTKHLDRKQLCDDVCRARNVPKDGSQKNRCANHHSEHRKEWKKQSSTFDLVSFDRSDPPLDEFGSDKIDAVGLTLHEFFRPRDEKAFSSRLCSSPRSACKRAATSRLSHLRIGPRGAPYYAWRHGHPRLASSLPNCSGSAAFNLQNPSLHIEPMTGFPRLTLTAWHRRRTFILFWMRDALPLAMGI